MSWSALGFVPGSGRNGCYVLVVSVGHLDLGWCVVAEGFVESGGVPPVHPAHGGRLDGFDGFPEPLGTDEFGLVEAVHRLGQGVVVRVTDRAHRGLHSGRDERVRVRRTDVLGGFNRSLQRWLV